MHLWKWWAIECVLSKKTYYKIEGGNKKEKQNWSISIDWVQRWEWTIIETNKRVYVWMYKICSKTRNNE